MKARIRELLIAVLALAVSAGAAAAQDKQLRIGGSGVGGTFYVMASAIAHLVDQHIAGYSATALPAAGSPENIRKLKLDQIDLAMIVPDAGYYAHKGEGPFKSQPYPELRTVTNTYSAPFMIATLADSGIKSIADIKGKSLGVGNPGGLEHFYADVVLQAYGFGLKDVNAKPMAIGDRTKALGDSNIDAAVFLVGVTSAVVKELTTLHDVRFLPLSDKAMTKITNEHPFYSAGAIPKDTFKGQMEPVSAIYVVNPLVTRANMPESFIYQLTKLMFEKKDELVKMQPLAAELDPMKGCKNVPAPLHPGAERYFREVGCLK